MKKKLTVLTLILALFLCSCGYSAGDFVTMKKYKVQGSDNAKNYIKEKYGFEAEVVDVDNEYPMGGPIPDLTPMPTGFVTVKMKYQGKEFNVEIAGNSKNTDGKDDYQKEEILSFLEEYIIDAYPTVDGVSFPSLEDEDTLFGPYLTGDNFFDYIDEEDYKSHIVLKLFNKDVKEFPIDQFRLDFPCDSLSVINYKDKSKMPNPDRMGYFSAYEAAGVLPYISQYLYYEKNSVEDYEPEYFEVFSASYDGLIVCVLQDEPITIEKLADAEMPNSEVRHVASYHLRTNADRAFVYIPKDVASKDEDILVRNDGYDVNTDVNDEYVYFDDIGIVDDSDGYTTSFDFNIFAKKK
ncbi:hypothetical protein SAMN02910298_00248 [Pseudobutyrivibrio sp. YE44]|uniref:hypothetical protein n=1 Tax=Pseudobutyrivibrio sp. YE44 TaxID=1520802 RepID=UPI00088277C1|nr:hypothetical protein [Pseudobutyrivibrio sp. YE44]SDB07484.1 hypothetical protein SAMN02910298_00248 [Pseudobutyrivibrio sp. YE44]